MGFLAPWFLGGLLAAGLPLWIHLLRRHSSTPQKFSSLMFFERRTQSSVKHRRLHFLLLLALRLALLVLLALAFAKPFFYRSVAASSGPKRLLIIVDDSFSMRYGGHLKRAREQALEVLSSLRPSDRGQVLTLDSQLHALTAENADRDTLAAAIRSIEPGDARSSYAELSRALRALASTMKLPLEAHLVSDMQASSMPPAFADLRLPGNSKLVLHSVAESGLRNWAVENVTAPPIVYGSKQPRVQAVVAGYGTPAARRNVSLVLNDKVLDSKPADVPANGRVTVEFPSLYVPYGLNRGEIRIDGADALKEDDRFLFAVERTDPRHILLIHDAGDSRSLLYLQAALDATSSAAFTLDPLRADQTVPESLSRYAFVIVSDVSFLSPGLEDALRSYVNGGGGVLMALGPRSAPRAKAPVSGDPITAARYFSREGERFQTVAKVDATHPSMNRASRLEGVKFYQAIKINPKQARVIAMLTDDTPLLVEKQIGEGKLLEFASTFDNLSNDFPLHPSFVPFVEQTAYYLAGMTGRTSSALVNSHLELRSSKEQRTTVEVIGPTGARALTLAEAAKAEDFQPPRVGFYEIRRSGGRHQLVAVEADRRESDLSVVPEETLSLWAGTGSSPASPGDPGAPQPDQPWSFWRYLVALGIGIALAESFVASRTKSLSEVSNESA